MSIAPTNVVGKSLSILNAVIHAPKANKMIRIRTILPAATVGSSPITRAKVGSRQLKNGRKGYPLVRSSWP
jgi:hypothetical protein